MARVRSISRGTQDVRLHQSEVDCFFQTVRSEDGTVYLHLSTFGSDHRKSAPKSSQTLQLDEQTAGQLVDIIHKTFDI